MENEKNLGKCLGRAHRAQAKFLDEILKPYGLWHGQLFLLKYLLSKQVQCHKELCRNRLIDKAAVSRAVSKLCESGYLQKKKDPSDKRKSVLLPTEKAKKFAVVLDDLLEASQNKALEGFSEKEREELFDFLARIVANLDKGERLAK